MATENLLRIDAILEADIRQDTFDNRRQKPHQVVCLYAILIAQPAMGNITFQGRPKHQRTRRLIERFDVQEHATHIRMHENRICLLVRLRGSG